MAEDYSGMTVNERLFAAGLLDAYDRAVDEGDEVALEDILARVKLRRDASGMHWDISEPNDAEDR